MLGICAQRGLTDGVYGRESYHPGISARSFSHSNRNKLCTRLPGIIATLLSLSSSLLWPVTRFWDMSRSDVSISQGYGPKGEGLALTSASAPFLVAGMQRAGGICAYAARQQEWREPRPFGALRQPWTAYA